MNKLCIFAKDKRGMPSQVKLQSRQINLPQILFFRCRTLFTSAQHFLPSLAKFCVTHSQEFGERRDFHGLKAYSSENIGKLRLSCGKHVPEKDFLENGISIKGKTVVNFNRICGSVFFSFHICGAIFSSRYAENGTGRRKEYNFCYFWTG